MKSAIRPMTLKLDMYHRALGPIKIHSNGDHRMLFSYHIHFCSKVNLGYFLLNYVKMYQCICLSTKHVLNREKINR